MKIAFLTGLALAACIATHAADPAPAPAADANSVFKNDIDKLSYSFGLNMGSSIKANSIDVNEEMIFRGIRDGIGGKQPLLTQQQIQEIQDKYRKEMLAKREAKNKELREKNKGEGEKFLADNSKKEGVKTTESGLQYKVLKEGTGPKPKLTDRVAVQYRGTTIDGKEFDSSSKRGPDPAVFGVTQVIRGWTEALTNMNVGSKWEVYIPSNLGYGEQGSRNIEPNSTLIFDVELVDIKQPEPPPQPVTSDIIKVPSKAELDKGAKIEIIKPEDLKKLTNQPASAPTK